MAGILIIAHAPLATALRDCVMHIYGNLSARIGTLDVLPDSDSAQILAQAHAEIKRLREENGVLVLTDLFGATPANIATHLATLSQVSVLAGANLSMLVCAACYLARPLDVLVEKVLAGAQKGIHVIGPDTSPPQAPCDNGCLPGAMPTGAKKS